LQASELADHLGQFRAEADTLRSYFAALASGTGVTAAIALSAEGAYVDPEGGSAAFSSRTDRFWLKTLRAQAEAVLTTGATVRAEKLRQTECPFVIATESGDVTGLRHSRPTPLHIASPATEHESWPAHAQHFGAFAGPLEVLAAAKLRWQRLQVEYGYGNLVAGFERGLIDAVFITVPESATEPVGFGRLEALVSFDGLTLYRTRRRYAK
jgi:hypothetical protein